jgi:hypothetical protein
MFSLNHGSSLNKLSVDYVSPNLEKIIFNFSDDQTTILRQKIFKQFEIEVFTKTKKKLLSLYDIALGFNLMANQARKTEHFEKAYWQLQAEPCENDESGSQNIELRRDLFDVFQIGCKRFQEDDKTKILLRIDSQSSGLERLFKKFQKHC